jgi:hypothetical protein
LTRAAALIMVSVGCRIKTRPVWQITVFSLRAEFGEGPCRCQLPNPSSCLWFADTRRIGAASADPRRPAGLRRRPRFRRPDTSLDMVLAEAKRRAASPYVPQHGSLPAWLDRLGPDQYRSIRFNPELAIWRADGLPFRIDLLPVGFNFQTTVTVSVIDNGKAQDLLATPICSNSGRTRRHRRQRRSCRCRVSASATDQFEQGLGRISGVPGRELFPGGRAAIRSTAYRRAGLRSTPPSRPARNSRHSRISGSSGPRRTRRRSSFTRCSKASRRPARIASPCSRAARPRWTSI